MFPISLLLRSMEWGTMALIEVVMSITGESGQVEHHSKHIKPRSEPLTVNLELKASLYGTQ